MRNRLILGVDEAGRGPVIGPMIVAGTAFRSHGLNRLDRIGVADSKRLSPGRREALFPMILDLAERVVIREASPRLIDSYVGKKEGGMNRLEAEMMASITIEISPDEVIIDAPGRAASFERLFRSIMDGGAPSKMILVNRADETYSAVMAASIIAKVERDRRIAALAERLGDIGSGYPSDPRTKRYLAANHSRHPEIFRRSWATFRRISG